MTTKFTPIEELKGLKVTDSTSRQGCFLLYDADLREVALIWDFPEAKQVAQKLSAAGDLYEACKTMLTFLDRLENGVDENDPIREMRRQVHAPLRAKLGPAIAKAEGR